MRLVAFLALAAMSSGCVRTTDAQSRPAVAGASMPTAPATEEFVGPFPSWTNVKVAYGAVGDGTADDTAALRQALSDIGSGGHSPVVYLPAGRYRITGPLTVAHLLNVSLIGEDPATVTIVWDGPPGGTMLVVNGVAYSKFSRMTFDGRGRASIAINQSWDQQRPNFDTGNEYSDHVFVDVEYGIHGGFKGGGFAETSILRSRFVRNRKAGVALGNFNALDIWVWHSLFEDCAVGVTNEPGAGNFRVYSSVFRRSSISDLMMQNTGGFSARGNYSIGSKAFYTSVRPISHPATIEIQGNTVLDTRDARAINLGNQGPALLLDNTVRSLADAVGPVVTWRSFLDADLASIGNTFTVSSAVSTNGRLISLGDRVVAAASLAPIEPLLPGVPPNRQRRTFEVAAGADGAAIQLAIDAATRVAGRAVVHIPHGLHEIRDTLVVPAGDVQIVGDGYGTQLKWVGIAPGPVMRITGPTKATLRELQVMSTAESAGIIIENVDQPGARLYLDSLEARGGAASNIFVDHLKNADVEFVNLGHAYSNQGVSMKLLGGQTTVFSGASSGNALSYEVSDGARVLLRDLWYEGDAPNGFARISGAARFTMQASRVAMPPDRPAPSFAINGVNGEVSILTTHLDDRIDVAGDGAKTRVLALGLLREHAERPRFSDTSAPRASAVVANMRQRSKAQGRFSVGSFQVPDIGRIDPAFLEAKLADARRPAGPRPLLDLDSRTSDVRMFRVWVGGGLHNVWLR